MAHRIRYRQLGCLLAAVTAIPLSSPRWVDAGVARSHRMPEPAPKQRRTSQARPVAGGAQVEVNRPRTVFDCDTPRGEAWYGSAERCLQELCVGGNFTNQYVDGADNRPRKNPCYGRDPYELQR